MKVMPKMSRVH